MSEEDDGYKVCPTCQEECGLQMHRCGSCDVDLISPSSLPQEIHDVDDELPEASELEWIRALSEGLEDQGVAHRVERSMPEDSPEEQPVDVFGNADLYALYVEEGVPDDEGGGRRGGMSHLRRGARARGRGVAGLRPRLRLMSAPARPRLAWLLALALPLAIGCIVACDRPDGQAPAANAVPETAGSPSVSIPAPPFGAGPHAPVPEILADYLARVRGESEWTQGRVDLFDLEPLVEEGVLETTSGQAERRRPLGVQLAEGRIRAHNARVISVRPDGFRIEVEDGSTLPPYVVLPLDGVTPGDDVSEIAFEVALPEGGPPTARIHFFSLTAEQVAQGRWFEESERKTLEVPRAATTGSGFVPVRFGVSRLAGVSITAIRIDLPPIAGDVEVRRLQWIAVGDPLSRIAERPDDELAGLRMGRALRPGRAVAGQSRITIEVPEHMRREAVRLDVALAALARRGDPVEARIVFDDETVYRQTLRPDSPKPAWLEFSTPLVRADGRVPRRIALETEGGDESPAVLWAAPRLLREADAPPAVLLVTFDTVRRDRASGFGGPNPTLGAIDARTGDDRSFRFVDHRSESTVTTPSHASILTGQTPHSIGILANGNWSGGSSLLRDPFLSLAEIYSAAGYETGAFVSAAPLAASHGLAQGFDVYDGGEQASRLALDTVLRAADWLRGRRGRPIFLWLHLYDPHNPYEDAPPFYRDRFISALDPEVADDLTHVVLARYDGEIAYADAATTLVLAELDLHWPDAETSFVLTADHGESFGEHGITGDHFGLYDVNLRIPFIIRGPASTRSETGERVIDAPTSNLDVAPTLLGMSRLPVPPWMQGLALFDPAGRLRPPPASRPRHAWWQNSSGVVVDGLRLLNRPEPLLGKRGPHRPDAPREVYPAGIEFYDVRRDPDEVVDLAGEDDERLARLKAALEAGERPPPGTRPIEKRAPAVSDLLRQQLEALGYDAGRED
mgnify:CR=1 FL=1